MGAFRGDPHGELMFLPMPSLSGPRRHGAGDVLVLETSCGAPEASRVGSLGTTMWQPTVLRGRLFGHCQFAKSDGCGMTAFGAKRTFGPTPMSAECYYRAHALQQWRRHVAAFPVAVMPERMR